jgi:Arc/MetJ family transcription regulator
MTPNRTNILLDSSLLAEAKQMARRQRSTATRVVEQALREYIDRHGAQKSQPYALEEPGRRDLTERAEKIRRRLHRPEGW